LLLRLYGCETRQAYTAASALEIARNLQPHVMLSELAVDDLDGCDLARIPHDELLQAALVALTGREREKDFTRSREAGFHYHLVKPVAIDLFLEVMARVRDA
jgi:CheY-like chemotaxis protein